MYLSRLALNPRRRGARPLLASPQAMHAAVLAGFPPRPPAEPPVSDDDPTGEDHAAGRVLWRVDRDGHALWLYVLSPSEPDLSHLVEQAGWPATATWQTRPYDRLLDRVVAGSTWAFRLRANPVKQARDIGKRVGHLTAEQQAAWLVDRAKRHGFTIRTRPDGTPDVVVADRQTTRFRRGRSTVTLTTARYDGTLDVSDPDVLRRTLATGIGRAKAYGCGLLTVVPLRTPAEERPPAS